MVFGMPTALFPAFALHRLGGERRRSATSTPRPSAGALVGSLVSGWTSHVRRQGVAVTVAACAWGCGDRRLRLHDVALAGARLPRPRRRCRLLQRRPAQHDPAAGRRPTTCSGGCRGSSSRRWQARRTSATSRPACSRRSRRCDSRSSRAACSASIGVRRRRRSRCPIPATTTAVSRLNSDVARTRSRRS